MAPMNEHYSAVLADLRDRKTRLETELAEVNAAIGVLGRVVGGGPPAVTYPSASDQSRLVVSVPLSGQARIIDASMANYANISVRWSVLWRLAEFATGFEKTGDIAKALIAGGYKTDAANFPNMVSAVLSKMKQQGEVITNQEGGYALSDAGRQNWLIIKHGPKFREATSPSAPLLPSVQ